MKTKIRWGFAVFFALMSIGTQSTISTALVLLSAFFMCPICPVQEKIGSKLCVICAIVLLIVGALISPAARQGANDGMNQEEPSATATATPEETPLPAESVTSMVEAEHSLKFGELLSWIENNIDGKNVLVVKAKISDSYSNKATIDQNYMNVADIIKNQNGDTFDEIQYWAVADMTDGSESKVISFTLDKSTIQGIKDENIVDIQLGDYVTDLWILPSLQS